MLKIVMQHLSRLRKLSIEKQRHLLVCNENTSKGTVSDPISTDHNDTNFKGKSPRLLDKKSKRSIISKEIMPKSKKISPEKPPKIRKVLERLKLKKAECRPKSPKLNKPTDSSPNIVNSNSDSKDEKELEDRVKDDFLSGFGFLTNLIVEQ